MASTKNLKKRGNTFTYTHTYAHNKRCHAYLYRSLSFLIRNRVEWIDEKREEKRFNALHFNEFPCAVERDKYLCRHYSAVFMSFIVIHISLRRRLYQIFFSSEHTQSESQTHHLHTDTQQMHMVELVFHSFLSRFFGRRKRNDVRNTRIKSLDIFHLRVCSTTRSDWMAVKYISIHLEFKPAAPKKDVSIECELMMLLLLLYITSLRVDNRSWFETGIAPAQQQPSAAQSTTHMFEYLIVFYTAF